MERGRSIVVLCRDLSKRCRNRNVSQKTANALLKIEARMSPGALSPGKEDGFIAVDTRAIASA